MQPVAGLKRSISSHCRHCHKAMLRDVLVQCWSSNTMGLPPSDFLTNPEGCAFFLDFDGTLVEIADRPSDVSLSPQARRTLELLIESVDGAVAVVSGRDIAVIDEMLAPLVVPIAGVHGAIRRDGSRRLHGSVPRTRLFSVSRRLVAPFVESNPGLLVERKALAVALHYRLRPDLQTYCEAIMKELAATVEHACTLKGDMVVEVRLQGPDKGAAIRSFMQERPFEHRKPVSAGDDVTDEAAFEAVNALGGESVKVGLGATSAHWRVADSKALVAWLAGVARHAQENRCASRP